MANSKMYNDHYRDLDISGRDDEERAEKCEYRLGSSSLVYAPGLIAWAINGAKFKKDRKSMVNVVAQTWSIPEAAALALLTEAVPFKVEDDAVMFAA